MLYCHKTESTDDEVPIGIVIFDDEVPGMLDVAPCGVVKINAIDKYPGYNSLVYFIYTSYL
jgi:hypothetical protein